LLRFPLLEAIGDTTARQVVGRKLDPNAVTGEEKARVLDGANVESTTAVEPLSNYFVGRVSREVRGGNTIVSLGGTVVNRDLSDTVFKNLLRTSADVGSLDFEHRWANKQWSLTGAMSKTL